MRVVSWNVNGIRACVRHGIPILELRFTLDHRVALQPQALLKLRSARAVGREVIGDEMNLDEVGDKATGQNGCRLVLLSEQHPQRGRRCQ